MSESQCYVYVIATVIDGEACAPVKVGMSNTPLARLRELQTASPHKLTLTTMMLCPHRRAARDLEAGIHGLLSPWSLSGEWFNVPPIYAAGAIATELTVHLGFEIKAIPGVSRAVVQ